MRKKLWSAVSRKLQAGFAPLLYGNVSVHFLVCEHSQLKEEVGLECGVQESLSEMSAIWVLTAGVNGRSDAFRALAYNFLDFRLVNCLSRLLPLFYCVLSLRSNKLGIFLLALRKTRVATDIFYACAIQCSVDCHVQRIDHAVFEWQRYYPPLPMYDANNL